MVIWLSAQLGWVRLRLDEVREASRFVESAIARHRADIDARAKDAEQRMNADEAEYYLESLGEEDFMVREIFPQTLRRALLTTAMSMLENELNLFCERHARRRNLAIEPTDLTGKGIRRSRLFILKVLELPFPESTAEWNEILSLSEIRDAIVHRGGRVKPENKGVRQFISRWDSIELDEDRIILHHPFIEQVVDVSERFWAALVQVTRQPSGD